MGAKEVKTNSNKKLMLKTLVKTMGVVTSACNACNLSRTQFYEWMDEDEEFKRAVTDVKEQAIDFAESKLFEQIQDKNVVATIFYLKTQGKKRGYVERTEHEEVNRDPIEVHIIEGNGKESKGDG